MAIIGIDLGTTNSLAAVWKDGHATLIPNRLGSCLTPSVVTEADGAVWVGTVAKEKRPAYPGQSVPLSGLWVQSGNFIWGARDIHPRNCRPWSCGS